jgi:hypothetical protein
VIEDSSPRTLPHGGEDGASHRAGTYFGHRVRFYSKIHWHQASALAYGIDDAAADEGRRDRARQQDRQNGLGDDGQGERYKEPVALAA